MCVDQPVWMPMLGCVDQPVWMPMLGYVDQPVWMPMLGCVDHPVWMPMLGCVDQPVWMWAALSCVEKKQTRTQRCFWSLFFASIQIIVCTLWNVLQVEATSNEALLFFPLRHKLGRSLGGCLVAAGAGGWTRFWNVYTGQLVGSFQICGGKVDAGIFGTVSSSTFLCFHGYWLGSPLTL